MSWRAALIPQLSRPQFLASLEIAAIGALIREDLRCDPRSRSLC